MKKLLIPSHIQIEVFRGCNAKCEMCPLNLNYPKNEFIIKKGRMSEENFQEIVNKFLPYVSQIKYVSLWELGEPLLDRGLFKKIKYLKKYNFKNIAIATNADLLDEKKQIKLLKTGIDTIICSIDSIDKKTHESIRMNTNFERVVKNVQSCIEKRNKGNYKTRFLIRMIRQELNYLQWPKYVEYWEKFIDRTKRDDIIAFNIHNWGGTISKEKVDFTTPCLDINERMIIDFNGEVTLCCGENPIKKKIKLGNVLFEDPIKIFNNEIFRHYRKMNIRGLRGHLDLCKECNIPDRRRKRILSTTPHQNL